MARKAKFKIGDKVRVFQNLYGTSGIGTEFDIIDVYDRGNETMYVSEKNGSWSECNLKLVKKNSQEVKEQPIRFIVTYEKHGTKEIRSYTDKKELVKRLKEAKDDTTIVFSTFKVFEVKKQYKVNLRVGLTAMK